MSIAAETIDRSSQTYASAYETAGAGQKSYDYGKTIGTPKLSEEGQKYYDELKKKFGNMDFILVSADMKEQAKAQAAGYANPNKTVVLIDEEKIERMATDENFRKQYEGIISNAINGMAQLKTSIQSTGASVKGYGIKVNDGGTASLFAVLKKSSAAQKERIAKNAQENREEKKTAQKKAAKQEQEAKLRKKRTEEDDGQIDSADEEDTVTITADSIEELLQKINDYTFADRSNHVQTQEEQMLGQHIDFRG